MHDTTRLTVIEAYRALRTADAMYAEHPSHATNAVVVTLQRVYGANFGAHLRTELRANRITYSEYINRRAQAFVTRARSNMGRQTDNPTWQDMARHQHTRARAILRRARAYEVLNNG
jgi:hypothetical protein